MEQIKIIVLFVGIVAMIFSGAMGSAKGQNILNNEQLVNPPFIATDTDFLKFMQLM
jgi:hypothetical protein